MQARTFYSPPLSPLNKMLIIVVAVLFTINMVAEKFFSFSLVPWMGLSLTGIKSGLISQFLTFPFVSDSFFNTFFSLLIVWFMGSELEFNWGKKFYLKFLAFTVVCSGLIYVTVVQLFFSNSILIALPLNGLSGINYSLLVAYAYLNSDRYLSFLMLFPMKAKYFCLLLAVFDLYNIFLSNQGKVAWAHLFAMPLSYAFLLYYSKNKNGFSWRNIFTRVKDNRAIARRKSFKLIKEEKDSQDKPKYWN